MNVLLGQLGRIVELREQRAQKRLLQRRAALDRVCAGLHGAGELQAALTARLRGPEPGMCSAADLRDRHEHARRVGHQLQEIERLAQRARENESRLRLQVDKLSMAWRQAQGRNDEVRRQHRAQNQRQALRQQQTQEESVLDGWHSRRPNARSEQR